MAKRISSRRPGCNCLNTVMTKKGDLRLLCSPAGSASRGSSGSLNIYLRCVRNILSRGMSERPDNVSESFSNFFPVGAAVGGIVGGVAGSVIDPPPQKVVTYVQQAPAPAERIVVKEKIVVGQPLPQTVVVTQFPRSEIRICDHQRSACDRCAIRPPQPNTHGQLA